MQRTSEVTRNTSETEITVRLNLDGRGDVKLEYPVGFMVHMLNTFARHGLFDLDVKARGDLEVDQHHLLEDTGIVLGQCFAKALGDKRGIRRTGSCVYPMDETLVCAAVDISGRAFLVFNGGLTGIPLVSADQKLGASAFQVDTVEDFWQGFALAAGMTLHLDVIRGRSDHHKIEALFKAASRAIRAACEIDERARDAVPSTKGSLGIPGFEGPGVRLA